VDCSRGSLLNAARVIKGLERSDIHDGYCDRSSAIGGDSEFLKISRPRNGVPGFIAKRDGSVEVAMRLVVVKQNILLIFEYTLVLVHSRWWTRDGGFGGGGDVVAVSDIFQNLQVSMT
jgi:hypothetical protein